MTSPIEQKLWKIGAEGRIFMGEIFAAVAGLYMEGLPAALHILLALQAELAGTYLPLAFF